MKEIKGFYYCHSYHYHHQNKECSYCRFILNTIWKGEREMSLTFICYVLHLMHGLTAVCHNSIPKNH
jgi:hypothetical protein